MKNYLLSWTLPIINVALQFQKDLGKAEARWGSDITTATRGIMQSCKRSFVTTLYTLSNDSEDPPVIILTFKDQFDLD
jgi:hypothetical protein